MSAIHFDGQRSFFSILRCESEAHALEEVGSIGNLPRDRGPVPSRIQHGTRLHGFREGNPSISAAAPKLQCGDAKPGQFWSAFFDLLFSIASSGLLPLPLPLSPSPFLSLPFPSPLPALLASCPFPTFPPSLASCSYRVSAPASTR